MPPSSIFADARKKLLGQRGESAAEQLVKNAGYTILARNYHNRFGEIDLIARREDEIAMIEVKLRTSAQYGKAADAVTPQKQKKIVNVAMAYLQENRLDHLSVRFDVIAIDADADDQWKTDWLQHAFDVDS